MSIFSLPTTSPAKGPFSFLARVKNRPSGGGERGSGDGLPLAEEPHFLRVLELEHKRAERSGKHFLLALVEVEHLPVTDAKRMRPLLAALCGSIRDTDQVGWFRQGKKLGVILTDVDAAKTGEIVSVLEAKMRATLRSTLSGEHSEITELTFRLFPAPPDLESREPAARSQRTAGALKSSGQPATEKRKVAMV